jgi:hypothetical protein
MSGPDRPASLRVEHTADEAERSRIRFADERLRLRALAEDSHTRLLALITEHETLQAPPGSPSGRRP